MNIFIITEVFDDLKIIFNIYFFRFVMVPIIAVSINGC